MKIPESVPRTNDGSPMLSGLQSNADVGLRRDALGANLVHLVTGEDMFFTPSDGDLSSICGLA